MTAFRRVAISMVTVVLAIVSPQLVSAQTAAGSKDRSQETKAMAPGLDDIEPLAVVRGKYLFGPMLVRGAQGRLHMQFFRGEDHFWRRPAHIGYAFSDDDGRSWTEAPDVLGEEEAGSSDSLRTFGRTKSGKLISLFVRRAPGQPVTLRQTASIDDGRSWSSSTPIRLAGGEAAAPDGSTWFYPYGAIKHTPSGKLVVMAYRGEDNFVLVSSDEGETWTRHLMASSKRPDYSEMGVEIVDEKTWIAVSRVDGQRSRMAQFVTRDGGLRWSPEGPLNLPTESDTLVAPTIDAIQVTGRRLLMLSYCDRRSNLCWLQIGEPAQVVNNPRMWGQPRLFDKGFRGRSGYQSFVVSKDGTRLIGALVRERSDAIAELVVFQTPRLTELAP